MANGASRLFEVMKNTGESTNNTPSQLVSLTIKSVNPLILVRDDRLEIPAEFCILHKSLDINNFRINDVVTAIVLNNGQQYFIIYNNTAEEQGANYNDLSNKPKINGVELNGNKTSDDLLIVSKSELQQIVQDMTTNINNKVTKSGDTLTGELNFQNKNDYAVFRKTRTINGTDYNANFGIGANQSARIEFQDANENVLGNLEVRSGSIYNGKSGKKLIEADEINFIHSDANSTQFSFTIGDSGGYCTYIVYGGWQKHFMYLLTIHPGPQNVVGYSQIFNNTGEANITNVTMSNHRVTITFSSTIWGGIQVIGQQAKL